jgi:hypothetical protein
VSGPAKFTTGARDPSSFRSTGFDTEDVADGELTRLNHHAEREQPQIHVENGGAVDRRDLANRVRFILETLRLDKCVGGVGVREQAVQGVAETAKGWRALIRRRVAQRVSPVGSVTGNEKNDAPMTGPTHGVHDPCGPVGVHKPIAGRGVGRQRQPGDADQGVVILVFEKGRFSSVVDHHVAKQGFDHQESRSLDIDAQRSRGDRGEAPDRECLRPLCSDAEAASLSMNRGRELDDRLDVQWYRVLEHQILSGRR